MTIFSSHHTILLACVQKVLGQCGPFVPINTGPGTSLCRTHKQMSPNLPIDILHNVDSFSVLFLLAVQCWNWNPGIAQARQVLYHQSQLHPYTSDISNLTFKINTYNGVITDLGIA